MGLVPDFGLVCYFSVFMIAYLSFVVLPELRLVRVSV